MQLDQALQLVPKFVLVFFRLAGMMTAAPLFGSARVPRRIKLMIALVLAVGMMPSVAAPVTLPDTTWKLAAGIAAELVFGLAIGTALSFVFVAVSWAGDIIGQQMGLGLGAALDPQFGGQSSVVGDLYFFLTLVIFLLAQGHHAFLRGVALTFESLPLLAVGMDKSLLDLVVGLLHGATALALKLAAPVLVTMLLTDVVLGFVGKTVPQLNVMSAGLPLRSLLGMLVLWLGLVLASRVIRDEMLGAMETIAKAFERPVAVG